MTVPWFTKVALVVLILFTATASSSKYIVGDPKTYIVGDSVWTMPPSFQFYERWAFSHQYYVDDVLYFDFESEMYNVVQVVRQDYYDCGKYMEFKKIYNDGPVSIPLTEEGDAYFICTIMDYCKMGLKTRMVVHRRLLSPPSS